MGIIKAGAAYVFNFAKVFFTLLISRRFSVIDPLYPPDRQQIYLDVAQPQALVIIEKATQEAGPLDAKVQAFVKSQLNLKTTIPALRLQADGSLLSGILENGKDIFVTASKDATAAPHVILGPDDIPTLSFTSGST